MLQPPPPYSTNQPTPPPTPTEDTSISPQDRGTPSSVTRRPLPPITTLSESSSGNDSSISPDAKRQDEKIKKLTGSVEALLFHNAVLVQANPPWYLKPRHAEDIRTDTDGKLISGTRTALVERLVWDTIPSPKDTRKAAQDTAYRCIFLMTFRTFMAPDELFDMLVGIYRMCYPKNLTESEFVEWRERCLHPTQFMVLIVFTMWLEEHRLLEEEPHISLRLIEFLELIKPPSPLTVTAQSIIQSITRLTFATSTTTTSSPHSRLERRAPENDLSSFQPSDLAEQLSLHEFKLYSKITPQDCIAQATQSPKAGCPKARESLSAFCATHDKLAVWVTDTILSNHQLSGRSNTVDFWIKVAEKCRNLNNFASMSAIINALSGTVISRLNLTWLHVGRKNTLEKLLKFNEPSGGFSGYRHLHLHAEGSCVPFIGMYMTDLVHIKDQYADEDGRVSILQRQRCNPSPTTLRRTRSAMNFIQNNLRGATKEWQAKFWSKTQEVQRSEVTHTDIRKGLVLVRFQSQFCCMGTVSSTKPV
ncbi:ras GEF [Gymnopus androsaceus JB14]|uniref:Ras GEF n=1 Tax=Gymnopus androsaceus JB14 TaxID=1447944 RepID=A0A6A4HUJ5_9AGAR|nr:ras GEF [Gymnopus androsaceus JB14]